MIASPEVASIKEPWVLWNNETCAYEETTDPAAEYVPQLRKIVPPYQIGYMHYGDTDPFGVANSASMKKMAALAGFQLDVYNLKYPSTTEPLTQARNAVLKKDAGVIQAQQLDSLSNAFLDILQTKGCIPSVQMYLKVANVPSFGAVWADSGTTQGQWLAQQAKARAGSPKDTALVECTDPDVGSSVNIMFDTAPKALSRGRLRDPERQRLQDHLQVLADAVRAGRRDGVVHRPPELQARDDQHDRRRADAGRDQRAEAERPLRRHAHHLDRLRRPRPEAIKSRPRGRLDRLLPGALRRVAAADPRGRDGRQPGTPSFTGSTRS